MRNIALILTYLGTRYHGWQVQKNLPTVAQTVERAVAMVVGHEVHVTGCGRTDAGVHARVYVANFRTTSTIPVERLPYAPAAAVPMPGCMPGCMWRISAPPPPSRWSGCPTL